MGNYISLSLGGQANEGNEEAVFMIPRHINFTPMQMSVMIAAGQQPGVPFRVGGEGAQRPSRPSKKAQITETLGSINKSSFNMNINEAGVFSVSFKYDAIVPLSLHIFFGCKDSHSAKEIRPKRPAHQWGAFDLDKGSNMSWNSSSEFVDGDLLNLTCTYESDKANGYHLYYDFIVVLDSRENCQRYLSSHDGAAGIMQATYYTVNSSAFASPGGKSDIKKPNSHGSESMVEKEWNRKQQAKKGRSLDEYNNLLQQHSLHGAKGKIALTCRQQKIQMSGGEVYIVQDLYGMNTATPHNDNPSTSVVTSSSLNDNEEEDHSPVAYDTDSSECVICLTDEKEVVVYPCRHMCMCITCAEALPSQNNKCPMCRRPASMLLRLKSKNASDAY